MVQLPLNPVIITFVRKARRLNGFIGENTFRPDAACHHVTMPFTLPAKEKRKKNVLQV